MSIPERKIYYTTAGDNQSQIQSFYSNYWAESYGGRLPIFSQTFLGLLLDIHLQAKLVL
jgi:hypothetical protein